MKIAVVTFILAISLPSFANPSPLIKDMSSRGLNAISSSQVADYQRAIADAGKNGLSDDDRTALISIVNSNVDNNFFKSHSSKEVSTANSLLLYAAVQLAKAGEPVFRYQALDTAEDRQSKVAEILMFARRSDWDVWRSYAFEGYVDLINSTKRNKNALRPAEILKLKIDLQNIYRSKDLQVESFELQQAAKALVQIGQ